MNDINPKKTTDMNAYQRAYYQKYKDRLKKCKKNWRLKNPDYQKTWRQEHPEYQQEYVQQHRQQVCQYQRAYYHKHKEKLRAYYRVNRQQNINKKQNTSES